MNDATELLRRYAHKFENADSPLTQKNLLNELKQKLDSVKVEENPPIVDLVLTGFKSRVDSVCNELGKCDQIQCYDCDQYIELPVTKNDIKSLAVDVLREALNKLVDNNCGPYVYKDGFKIIDLICRQAEEVLK